MLRKFPNNAWMNGDIGAICQRVQVSAVPDAYTREVHDAQLLVDALWTVSPVFRQIPGDTDVNGDGRADLVAQNEGNTWMMRSTGSALTGTTQWFNVPFFGTVANHG